MRFVALVGVFVVVFGTASLDAFGAGGLVGHRAMYGMTLDSAEAATGIVDARGAMEYRFADTCDGWTVENRTFLTINYDEGDVSKTTWSFVSWESKDGLDYRFRVQHSRDDKIIEDLRGNASLDGAEGSGVARFRKPSGKHIDLPAGTMFPTRHLLALFRAAKGGGKRLGRIVFDGSGLDNPFEISAFMNPVKVPERKVLAESIGLDDVPAWSMRLAFFPHRALGPLPDFEMDVRYRADGIADRLLQDFGDFSLRVVLDELTVLPDPGC